MCLLLNKFENVLPKLRGVFLPFHNKFELSNERVIFDDKFSVMMNGNFKTSERLKIKAIDKVFKKRLKNN